MVNEHSQIVGIHDSLQSTLNSLFGCSFIWCDMAPSRNIIVTYQQKSQRISQLWIFPSGKTQNQNPKPPLLKAEPGREGGTTGLSSQRRTPAWARTERFLVLEIYRIEACLPAASVLCTLISCSVL